MALKQNLAGVFASLSASSSIRVEQLTDDGKRRRVTKLLHKVGTVEGRLNALESTIDSMVQEIKRLSLKIDVRGRADGTYQSGRDRSSGNLHPQRPPHQSLQHQPPPHQPPLYQPLPHQPPPRRLLQNFQYEDLSDEKELNKPSSQEDDFEDDYGDEEMAYKRGQKRMADPNPIKERGFLLSSNVDRRNYSCPNKYR